MTKIIFEKIIDYIFPIRKKIENFDYPDYSDLPKKISYKLSPEAVDAMQYILYAFSYNKNAYKRKYKFKRAYYDQLKELGEKVKFKLG